MIHLILAGGMGNQMFEYAYSLQLRKENPNEKICINSTRLKYGSYKRSYALHHFRLGEKVYISNNFFTHLQFFHLLAHLPYYFGISQLIAKYKKRYRDSENKFIKMAKKGLFHTNGSYTYFKPFFCKRRTKYIYGNFQSIETLKGIEEDLKAQFDIITPPSESNLKMLEKIRSVNAVCIHVRRGDYLDPKFNQLQVCDYEYYEEAIKRAKQSLDSPKFFIFSTSHEDIEWIKQNYSFDADITYVDLDNPDYEELRLMQACRHFIISNSTFSWWAAFLGKSEDKKVWVPAVWMKYGKNVNMYFDSWEKIRSKSMEDW